jgi:tetratricopeptide (TPR) repeat protein
VRRTRCEVISLLLRSSRRDWRTAPYGNEIICVIEEKPIAALLFLQARLPFSLSPLGLASGQFPRSAASLESSSPAESPAFVTAFLGNAYGASGDQVRAMAEMEDLKKRSLHDHVLPFNLALVYIGMGDRKRALDCLEQAYASDSQWMGRLKKDHIFDLLRSEPRFIALMRKLRFDS